MHKVSVLRNFVNQGWTIANRKAVVAQIGKEKFDEIATLAKKTDFEPIVFNYDYAKYQLKPDKINELKYLLDCSLRGIDPLWGKKLNLGKGEMNSEYYAEFKKMYIGNATFVDEKAKNVRRALFDKLKPLGCDKIHYRGESYNLSEPKQLEHFNKLKNLKVGDKYEPKTNMWISDSKEYAHNNYANTDYNNVRYTILANPDSKIIEMPYGRYRDSFFTEGVYDDRAVFEVCDRFLKGNMLELWLKHIR